MLTRNLFYNKKEEVPEKSKGYDPLTNEQFKKLMERFDGLETKVDNLEIDLKQESKLLRMMLKN